MCGLRVKRDTAHHWGRVDVAGGSMVAGVCIWDALLARLLEEQESGKEVSKPNPNNALPPARFHLLKVS